MADKEPIAKRRTVLGLIAIGLLIFFYRVFTVYTVRSGECRPNPIDPNLRVLTRTVNGALVSYPAREGFPLQQRPLLVMSYNIEGHNELIDGSHIQKIAAAINRMRPDIVGLQEVHRETWQSRFRDQLGELEAATGMHGWFAPSYVQWGGGFGNAILTRGSIVHAVVHPLPSVGEPRTLIDSVIDIDGTRLNFYVTHLTPWGSLNAKNRGEQLDCVARHVRTSRYPYILTGDFNNGQDAAEVQRFIRSNAAQIQICGVDIGITHPTLRKRIDYIFADWGWTVRSARVVPIGPSDHWPVTAELLWFR
jgi:endonuclease/exonuclease/phosphatase family metal-dependent hydrolase